MEIENYENEDFETKSETGEIQEEPKDISYFASAMRAEVAEDEEGERTGEESIQNNSESEKGAENIQPRKPSESTVGLLLSILTGHTDTASLSIIKKIHDLLGRVGKRGLDEKGKAYIEDLIKDLNERAPQLATLVDEVFANYGFDLNENIPPEIPLAAHFLVTGYRMNSINKELRAMNSQTENDHSNHNPKEKPWQ